MKIVKTFNSEKFSGVVLKVNDLIATFPLRKGQDIERYTNMFTLIRIGDGRYQAWLINAGKIKDFIQNAYESNDIFEPRISVQFTRYIKGVEDFSLNITFDFEPYMNFYQIAAYLISDLIEICTSLCDYKLKLKCIGTDDEHIFVNSDNGSAVVKTRFYNYYFAMSATRNNETYAIAREVLTDDDRHEKATIDEFTVEEGTIFDGTKYFMVAKSPSEVYVFNGHREFYRHRLVQLTLITVNDMSPDNIDEFCAKISGIRIPGKS